MKDGPRATQTARIANLPAKVSDLQQHQMEIARPFTCAALPDTKQNCIAIEMERCEQKERDGP